MAQPATTFEVPYREPLVESGGILSRTWEWFFRTLSERLYPLGIERSFDIVNNQSSAADITGMKFDKRGVSQAIVEYLIQRVTTSTGAVEEIESGIFICTYNPTALDWNISQVHENVPDDAGITFSITSAGQVQYTSDSVTGTASISKLYWRARTLGGKNALYSEVGKR